MDHLPECPFGVELTNGSTVMLCICSQLRACEQRVREEQEMQRLRAYEKGCKVGVQAARDTVAARLTRMGYDTEDTNPYLAAIDALAGQNRTENGTGLAGER